MKEKDIRKSRLAHFNVTKIQQNGRGKKVVAACDDFKTDFGKVFL